MRILSNLVLVLSVLIYTGCDDDPVQPPNIPDTSNKKVLVLNEGNFQRSNASIGLFDPVLSTYEEKQFKQINNRPIGDVLQSASIIKGNYWFVVNNSGSILVVDSSTLILKHVISNLTSPRYALYIPLTNKVWVSDLYSNEISIIDADNLVKVGAIPFNGWSEQMQWIGAQVGVTAPNSDKMYWLDATSGSIQDSIVVGYNVNSLVRHQNSLLALSAGRFASNDTTAVTVVNENKEITKRINLPTIRGASKLQVDSRTGNIYFLSKGVHYINPATVEYEGKVLDLSEKEVYGMDINPVTGNIYISDVKDFLKRSTVYIYRSNFELKDSFDAGIITNAFLFRN